MVRESYEEAKENSLTNLCKEGVAGAAAGAGAGAGAGVGAGAGAGGGGGGGGGGCEARGSRGALGTTKKYN